MKASLNNADQGSEPINFNTVSLQGSDLKLTSPIRQMRPQEVVE
jgi:hypothetical protein